MTIYYKNEIWAVTDYGLEMNKGTYVIAYGNLYQTRNEGMPCIVEHIFEKEHPKYGTKRQFLEAWLVAMAIRPRTPRHPQLAKNWYERMCMYHPEIVI